MSPETAVTPLEEVVTPTLDPKITYDDFTKVELRIGVIKQAEKLEKSQKLMKLKVDLGEEAGPRQVIAGIAKRYTPDELIEKRIVVVANLAPAKLMGMESNGMLLAGSDSDGNLELVSVPDTLPAGSLVK